METEEETCMILQFSDCTMMYILSFLDATSLFNLSRTCLYFKNIIEDPKLWCYVDARHEPNTTKKVQYVCNRIHYKTSHILLKAENKHSGLLSQDILTGWKTLQHLTVLALENQRFDGRKLTLLNFPETLEELSLKKTYVKNGKWFFQGSFNTMEYLRVLILDECDWLDSNFFMSVAKYPNLEILSIIKCTRLHLNVVPYLSVARHGCKKLKIIDCRFNTVGNEMLGQTHKSVMALYFQSMTSYQLDTGRPLMKFPPMTNANEDLISQSTIKDRSLEQYKNIIGGVVGELPQSILYQDPYPDCKCGWKDKANKEPSATIHDEEEIESLAMEGPPRKKPNLRLNLMPIDDYIDFNMSPQRFICRKHVKELNGLPKDFKNFFYQNQKKFYPDSSDNDSDSDDDWDCCMFGVGKSQQMIVLKIREADAQGNLPEPEVIDIFRPTRNVINIDININQGTAVQRPSDVAPEAQPSTSRTSANNEPPRAGTSATSEPPRAGTSTRSERLNSSAKQTIESLQSIRKSFTSSMSALFGTSMGQTSSGHLNTRTSGNPPESSSASTSGGIPRSSSASTRGIPVPSTSEIPEPTTSISGIPGSSTSGNSPGSSSASTSGGIPRSSSASTRGIPLLSTSEIPEPTTSISGIPGSSTSGNSPRSSSASTSGGIPRSSSASTSGICVPSTSEIPEPTTSMSGVTGSSTSASRSLDLIISSTSGISESPSIRTNNGLSEPSTSTGELPDSSSTTSTICERVGTSTNGSPRTGTISGGSPEWSTPLRVGEWYDTGEIRSRSGSPEWYDTGKISMSGSPRTGTLSESSTTSTSMPPRVGTSTGGFPMARTTSDGSPESSTSAKRKANDDSGRTNRKRTRTDEEPGSSRDNSNSSRPRVRIVSSRFQNPENAPGRLAGSAISAPALPPIIPNFVGNPFLLPRDSVQLRPDAARDNDWATIYASPQYRQYRMELAANAKEYAEKNKLRRLSLRGYREITDECLTFIRNLSLDLLDLTYTNTTKEGIEKFLTLNPNCRVLHTEYCVCKPRIPC